MIKYKYECNKDKIEYTKGITLISLIVTIIIILILAGVSINVAINENGPIKSAQKASLYQKYSTYIEELKNQMLYEEDSVYAYGNKIKKYISSINNSDLNNFIIIDGEMYFCGKGTREKEVADNLGINTSLAYGGSIEDLQTIIDCFEEIKENNITVPNKDSEETPSELVGGRLYDKIPQNDDKWTLAIDYDLDNKEIARYGSNYYYYPTSENEKNRYIIDYQNGKIIGLSENHKIWSVNSSLAVTGDLALNLDATSFDTDKAWENIIRHGDVEYLNFTKEGENGEEIALDNKQKKSLYFDGDGDYLELAKTGLSFENGFTFEFYGNLERLRYDNKNEGENQNLGLFCRIENLLEGDVVNSMRFGATYDDLICKFYGSSTVYGRNIGSGLQTISNGGIKIKETTNGFGYAVNEPFYLTFVYRRASELGETEDVNDADKIEYYVNGELKGYTYFGSDSFENAREQWDKDSCHFFVGCSPWERIGNIYYLKGNVYSVRLYQKTLTEEEVQKNKEATIQYRNSFIENTN